MKTRLTSVAVAFTLALPLIAAAQPIDGERLALAAADVIANYPRYTVFDHVTFRLDGSSVVLSGKVTMPFKKDEIGRRIARIDGVGDVQNEIDVLPVSQQDDRLRKLASRAIYGHSAFWGYAARANPPIHIVVENSRITLAGIVTSEVDRMLAQSLATGLGELSVTNRLVVENAKR